MQAHLHLCFLKRSCLTQVGWKLVAWGIFLAFVTSISALTPQAIIAWGSRDHQVSIYDGIVILHHSNQQDLIRDMVPTWRTKIPTRPDHLFDLTGAVAFRQLTSENVDTTQHHAADTPGIHPLFLWHGITLTPQILFHHGRHHHDSLLEQWSTICLLI